MSYRVHIAAIEIGTELIETACGVVVCEKDGLHAWLGGRTRFWGAEVDDVDCLRCLRARPSREYFDARPAANTRSQEARRRRG